MTGRWRRVVLVGSARRTQKEFSVGESDRINVTSYGCSNLRALPGVPSFVDKFIADFGSAGLVLVETLDVKRLGRDNLRETLDVKRLGRDYLVETLGVERRA